MMKNIVILAFVFSVVFANAQSDKTWVRQGNKSYQKDQFPDAEINYRKALDKNPNSLSANFNLADAMYGQKNYEKSAEIFAKIGQADLTKEQKGKAFYNLGNSFIKAKQYEQSIDAYKMALRNNPADEDARYNLDYARKMLKQQQQKKDQDKNKKDKNKKDQKKDQNKDKDKQDQQKDKQDQKKDQQDKKTQDQNQKNKQDKSDDQGKAKQQMNDQQSKKISKKDAERMLEALKNNEKKTLEKLKKGKKVNARVIKKDKDW